MNKIAVVTPVYNGEKFIKDCLQSVALSVMGENLTLEHIVIDDGSTDRTWEILQQIQLPHLRIFRLKENHGGSTARNLAVAKTQADWLFCLDADDVLFQNSLRSLFRFAQEKKAEWVYGDFLRTNENLTYLPGQDYYGYQFSSPSELLTSMFIGEHFFQQNCLYTRQAFETAGGFDESARHFEDFSLFTRFALKGYLPYYFPGPLYLHRFHPHNLSKQLGRENNFEAHRQDIYYLYQKYKTELKKVLSPSQIEKVEEFLKAH